jgi:hypothetical protein
MDAPKAHGRSAATVSRYPKRQDVRAAGPWWHRVDDTPRADRRPGFRAAVGRGRSLRHGVAMAVIAAAASYASLGTSLAATGTLPVAEIQIVGTPTLYVQAPPGTGTGYNPAWVTFRTSPHLHVALQLVTEVRGLFGRSFGVAGPRNCIRSTVINAVGIVKPGSRYEVLIYARPGQSGKATTVLGTYRLAAHAFASTARDPKVPTCG